MVGAVVGPQSMTNLITTWIESQTQCGEPIKQILEQLNIELGTSFGHNHLSMWRNGKRNPSPPVIRYMLESSLYYALKMEGFVDAGTTLEDEPYQRLAARLMPAKTEISANMALKDTP